jgi:hypothetical protein
VTRREKARHREADAELDRLTPRARLAVRGAQHLDAATLDRVFSTLVSRAVGDGHVANGAAKLLLDMARAAVEADVTDPDAKPLEEMSAEERVALYTALLREGAGDAGDDPTLPPPSRREKARPVKQLADMTPAEKAALMARIDQELARRDAKENDDGDQPPARAM